MLGYLLGALMTSISLGLVIVFSLEDSGAVEAAKDTLGPAGDIVLGAIFLIVARALSAERDAILRERRERRKAAKGKAKGEKGPPRWQRILSRGTPRTTFAVGALLTLPGASYLVALTRLAKDDLCAPETVLVILGFNLIMLALLELPLLSYWLEPEVTPGRVERFKASLRRDGRRIAIRIVTGRRSAAGRAWSDNTDRLTSTGRFAGRPEPSVSVRSPRTPGPRAPALPRTIAACRTCA